MSFTYQQILDKAKECKKSVENEYKLGINSKNAYYFCKLILNPKSRTVEHKPMDTAPKPSGTDISNQIYKKDYLKLAEYLVEFVEHRGRLPNFIKWGNYRIRVRDYVYLFARILIYIDKNGAYPKYANINIKVWVKPTEDTDTVFTTFTKKFGKITTFTDALRKIQGKGYGYYFDDYLSNLQVINNLSNGGQKPNCVDICQMMWHIAKGLKYDVRCLQVWCPVDEITHVRLQVKHSKYTNGEWENYDPASVCNGGSINSLWCTGSGSYTIATNPNWFMQNLNK